MYVCVCSFYNVKLAIFDQLLAADRVCGPSAVLAKIDIAFYKLWHLRASSFMKVL